MPVRRAVLLIPSSGALRPISLQIPNPFSFTLLRTLLRFFSYDSALFAQKHRGGGYSRPALPCDSHLPYILPSSVCSNPFVWHSYENRRGVGVFFPFRNGLHSVLAARVIPSGARDLLFLSPQLATISFTPETPSRRFPAPASAHFCSTPSSRLRPAPGSRKSARTRGACGNTQNIRPAFRAPGNTTCIRSRRRCPCLSAHGPDISPENRAPNRVAAPVPPALRRCPHTCSAANREFSPAAPGRFHETPDAPR